MRWSTDEEKLAIVKEKQAHADSSQLKEYECPKCGWHATSHGESGYGLDCPWGISPANREGRLPGQLEK